MNRVQLNKEEALWFSRSILKSIINIEAKARKDPAILKRNTYKTLIQIREQAELMRTNAGESNGLIFSMKQKILIKGIADALARGLEDSVIPVYVKRGLTAHELQATAKLSFLKVLARKLK